jgi:hypothetical protein
MKIKDKDSLLYLASFTRQDTHNPSLSPALKELNYLLYVLVGLGASTHIHDRSCQQYLHDTYKCMQRCLWSEEILPTTML